MADKRCFVQFSHPGKEHDVHSGHAWHKKPPNHRRVRAISQLFCIRMSVSIDTPNAFSMRSVISGDRPARSFSTADKAARVTPSALPSRRAGGVGGGHPRV